MEREKVPVRLSSKRIEEPKPKPVEDLPDGWWKRVVPLRWKGE